MEAQRHDSGNGTDTDQCDEQQPPDDLGHRAQRLQQHANRRRDRYRDKIARRDQCQRHGQDRGQHGARDGDEHCLQEQPGQLAERAQRQRRREHPTDGGRRMAQSRHFRPVDPQRGEPKRDQQEYRSRMAPEQPAHAVQHTDQHNEKDDQCRCAVIVERADRADKFGTKSAAADRADDDRGAHGALERIAAHRYEIRDGDRQQPIEGDHEPGRTGRPQGFQRAPIGSEEEIGEHLADHRGVEDCQRQHTGGRPDADDHHAEDRERQVGDRAHCRQQSIQRAGAAHIRPDQHRDRQANHAGDQHATGRHPECLQQRHHQGRQVGQRQVRREETCDQAEHDGGAIALRRRGKLHARPRKLAYHAVLQLHDPVEIAFRKIMLVQRAEQRDLRLPGQPAQQGQDVLRKVRIK